MALSNMQHALDLALARATRAEAKAAEFEQTLKYARDDQRTSLLAGFVVGFIVGVIAAAWGSF